MGRKNPKTISIGAASRWLAAKRKERAPVQLALNNKAIGLLNLILRAPAALTQQAQGLQQWKAKDEPGSRQVIRLQHWLEKAVLKKVTEERYDIPETWEGALPGTYVERLIEIVRHYEPVGQLVSFAESYYDLLDALKGEKPRTDLDELIGYKDSASEAGKEASR